MISKRQNSIGIKQMIRLEWMTKTTDLLLAGLDKHSIRAELHEFLAEKKGSGAEGGRGETSRTQAVNILMKAWVSPDEDLINLRDDALSLAAELSPDHRVPLHWAVISASYPFWLNVSKQCGRLLNLQNQISQQQVFSRLREVYGDRETVSRYARYTVRSFGAWDILKDSNAKGCYERGATYVVDDPRKLALLLECALLATPNQKAALSELMGSPGLFPFQLPARKGDWLGGFASRLSVMRYGLDEEMVSYSNAS